MNGIKKVRCTESPCGCALLESKLEDGAMIIDQLWCAKHS